MPVMFPSLASVRFCEVCDNATPQVWVEEFGEGCCQYCWEAYGECN